MRHSLLFIVMLSMARIAYSATIPLAWEYPHTFGTPVFTLGYTGVSSDGSASQQQVVLTPIDDAACRLATPETYIPGETRCAEMPCPAPGAYTLVLWTEPGAFSNTLQIGVLDAACRRGTFEEALARPTVQPLTPPANTPQPAPTPPVHMPQEPTPTPDPVVPVPPPTPPVASVPPAPPLEPVPPVTPPSSATPPAPDLTGPPPAGSLKPPQLGAMPAVAPPWAQQAPRLTAAQQAQLEAQQQQVDAIMREVETLEESYETRLTAIADSYQESLERISSQARRGVQRQLAWRAYHDARQQQWQAFRDARAQWREAYQHWRALVGSPPEIMTER